MALLDSSIITDDQKLVMRFAMEAVQQDNEEENEGERRMIAQMKEMKDSGSAYSEIAKAFDTDVLTVINTIKKGQ